MKKALIIVDCQNDFMPGGALAVPEGDKIVPIINQIQDKFDVIIATKDWHPEGHCSFKEQGGPWPIHCIQGTVGAELHKDIGQAHYVVEKGVDLDVDSYSGFYDNEKKKSTGLTAILEGTGIYEVYICGLALDYCVKFTALDAVSEGFKATVIFEATKAVNVNPGDGFKAIGDMVEAGVRVLGIREL